MVKLGKKIELLAFSVVMLMLIGSAFSATRTISSSNDNIYTMIRNSNGNYWEATPNNIQVAIDDLGSDGGIVWLPGAMRFNISDTVIIEENVILDLGGSSLEIPYEGDLTIVELKDGSGIRNGVIDVAGHVASHTGGGGSSDFKTYSNFTAPHSCIFLNASSHIESALIEDISLEAIGKGYNNDIPHYFAIHFNSSTDNNFWENSGNLVDVSTSTYATGNGTDSILLNDNTYDPADTQGYYGPRNITRVLLRAYVNYSDSSRNISLTPVFANGSLGDVYLLSNVSSPGYTSGVEITNDTNAPSPWTWQDLENLSCYVNISAEPGKTVSVAFIEIWLYTDSPPRYYDENRSGRGYGIHLYAADADIQQKITGVIARHMYFRSFENAIFIENNRGTTGNSEAHIDGNKFEYMAFNANENSVRISRNTADTTRQKVSTSGNVFNMFQMQAGRGSYYGGEETTFSHFVIGGYNNIFDNIMCWDPSWLRTKPNNIRCSDNSENCTSVILTSDSENTFMRGVCSFNDYTIHNGTNNIILDKGWSALNISSVIQKG